MFCELRKEAQSLGVNALLQSEVSRRVGELAVGPQLRYASSDGSVTLVDFFRGHPLTRETYPQVRLSLLRKLRTLHDAAQLTSVFDPYSTANDFLEKTLQKPREVTARFPLNDFFMLKRLC